LKNYPNRILPRIARTSVACALLSVAAVALSLTPVVADVLDIPATLSPLALRSPVTGIASSAGVAIAVGPRGVVLRSTDSGETWKQIQVPNSADLASVRFTDDNTAWVMGHDGIVLRSTDKGENWTRILDGRVALSLIDAYYAKQVAAGDEGAERVQVEIERAAAQSATPGVLSYPFFDIALNAGGEGFLVGAFGLLLHTTDGGASWEPWLERAENPRRMHLYMLNTVGNEVYLSGEQGVMRRLDRASGQFVTIETPYGGSFFGSLASNETLIVYGLRGTALVSTDGGLEWKPVKLNVDASIVAALPAADGRLVWVSQDGQVRLSDRDGSSVTELDMPRAGEVLSAALVAPRRLALGTHQGVRLVDIPMGRP